VKYTVKNVPRLLSPLYWLYTQCGALVVWGYLRLIQRTSRVVTIGKENIPPDRSLIFAMWHTENMPAFCADIFRMGNRPFFILNHPAWYMNPLHLVLRWLGVEGLALGSTGNSGREAADQVVSQLRKNYHTFINPDGPAGPPRVLKKGVLHIALQSGVPIVPVKVEVDREFIAFWTWDSKRYPFPGTQITVHFGEPLFVRDIESAQGELRVLLDGAPKEPN
jgi:lysophospholipid acyltransferase (LPLAT)-like uncharacterized protein